MDKGCLVGTKCGHDRLVDLSAHYKHVLAGAGVCPSSDTDEDSISHIRPPGFLSWPWLVVLASD